MSTNKRSSIGSSISSLPKCMLNIQPPTPDWAELLNPSQHFYGDERIEWLYRRVFENPNVLKAYFNERQMPGLAIAVQGSSPQAAPSGILNTDTPTVAPAAVPTLIPMDLAKRTANQAAHSGLVKPHERALVHLAALISPCGLFLATHGAECGELEGPPSWEQISFMRFYLLSQPLQKIKGVHVEMGNTLAAILGQDYSSEDVDIDQVTRLATAVRLSDTKLASYWSGQISMRPSSPSGPTPKESKGKSK